MGNANERPNQAQSSGPRFMVTRTLTGTFQILPHQLTRQPVLAIEDTFDTAAQMFLRTFTVEYALHHGPQNQLLNFGIVHHVEESHCDIRILITEVIQQRYKSL